MNKTLLITISIVLNCLWATAQDERPVIEDFAKGIKDVNTIVVNETLNVLQINLDNEKFDLVGIDNKMQEKWRVTLEGYALGAGKFKNKIVALASTDHTFFKGSNNIFKAYSVDPASGKLLVEKVVYAGNNDYMSYPQMSTGKGDFFKIAVRQSALKRKLHVGLPGPLALFSFNSFAKDFNTTTDLQVVDLDEHLEPLNSFKPAISNGSFVSSTWNSKGDMFIGWFNGPSIEVYKYEAGQTSPSAQLTASVSFEESKTADLSNTMKFLPSEKSDILYYATLYKNDDSKVELGVGKLDFKTNKNLFEPEVYDKTTLKTIKKNFIPVNKELDDVDMGYPSGLRLRFMEEVEGELVVALSSQSALASQNSTYLTENALILNGYNPELRYTYQTVLPAGYTVHVNWLQTGRHIVKNKLHLVANNLTGMRTMKGMYGVLDVKTGKWDKMEALSKKHIDKTDFVDGSSILWFGNGYVVPYLSYKGLMSAKLNVSLQQNEY